MEEENVTQKKRPSQEPNEGPPPPIFTSVANEIEDRIQDGRFNIGHMCSLRPSPGPLFLRQI